MCDNITIFVGGFTTMLCYFLSLNTKITLLTKYMNFRFRMNDKFVRKLMKHNRELKRLIDSLNVPLEPLDVPSEPLNVSSEPLDVPSEPLDVPSEPLDVPSEPLDVPSESLIVSLEPSTLKKSDSKNSIDSIEYLTT